LGVGLIWSGAFAAYITNSQADRSQYQTVYAQRLGRSRLQQLGYTTVTKPIAGGHRFGICDAARWVGRFDRCRWRTLRLTKCMGSGFRQKRWSNSPNQRQGGRIIAVGTTVVRALEGAAESGQLQPFCGKTNLFIYPGYQWRVVEGLITNFHLRSMLVGALIGRQRLLALYVSKRSDYRFYSAMRC